MTEELEGAMQQASHYAEWRGDYEFEVWCPDSDEEAMLDTGIGAEFCPFCGDAL